MQCGVNVSIRTVSFTKRDYIYFISCLSKKKKLYIDLHYVAFLSSTTQKYTSLSYKCFGFFKTKQLEFLIFIALFRRMLKVGQRLHI